ncbi:hypothetical protein ACSBR2_016884 [Camellia fascicularis]
MVVASGANPFAKEMAIRKRIASIFNKRQEDFPSLTEYNDYLEEVEDMKYEKENAEQIMNAQARKAEEYAAALAASKGQPAQADSDVITNQSSIEGHYAPAVVTGGGIAPLPIPVGCNHPEMQAYDDIDDEEMMKLRVERGGRAGGWSVELSRKRALEEAFSSIWI